VWRVRKGGTVIYCMVVWVVCRVRQEGIVICCVAVWVV